MRKWLKRLFCLHVSWHRAPSEDRARRLGLRAYRCDWCDKVKQLEREPVSML